VIRLAAKSLLMVLALLVAILISAVSWSGYRVNSAIIHGALRAKVEQCIDARHMALRDNKHVPQPLIDNVLARQVQAYYHDNPQRSLQHHILRASSDVGWRSFWSVDDRREIYQRIERRMRPCPGATRRYQQSKVASGSKAW
jgi:hypothetical protein